MQKGNPLHRFGLAAALRRRTCRLLPAGFMFLTVLPAAIGLFSRRRRTAAPAEAAATETPR